MLGVAEAEIRGAYESGVTCRGLAVVYGVPESTMRDFLRRAGVEVRPLGRLSPEDVAEMVDLRQAGWTLQALGDRFGVSRVAVKRRLDQWTAADAAGVDEPAG